MFTVKRKKGKNVSVAPTAANVLPAAAGAVRAVVQIR